MTRFELREPASIEEAVALLDADDASVRPIAGGTAIVPMMKSRLFRPTRLVSLRRLPPSSRTIEITADGELRIGALATLSTLEHSSQVAAAAPVMSRALRTLSNVRVRNVATLGGHLAHGDPHMDLPPILLTLGARIRAVSPRGERWLDIAELPVGYYQTSVAPDELIAEVIVTPQPAEVRAWYSKFTALSADDWPAVGVAVWYRLAEGEAPDRRTLATDTPIVEARIAVSAATDRPLRVATAEALLAGASASDEAFARAADAAAEEVEPLGDIRGSAAYKREMVRVHVRRALEQARAAFSGSTR